MRPRSFDLRYCVFGLHRFLRLPSKFMVLREPRTVNSADAETCDTRSHSGTLQFPGASSQEQTAQRTVKTSLQWGIPSPPQGAWEPMQNGQTTVREILYAPCFFAVPPYQRAYSW